MAEEARYLLVVVGLFFVPRILQRVRIPSAITCVAIGAILGMGFHLFHGDQTVPLLATLGIVSLFLFAGLEVDFADLRKGLRVVAGHLGLQVALLGGATYLFSRAFELTWRPALLFALAVLTPSTGFILDSLPGFGLTEDQQFWVKTKAVATELIALAALLVVVQADSVTSLGLSTTALIVMLAVLPFTFRFFAKRILPYAPKSEFAFLMILALVCAFVTRRLGVYYLVGAFIVGVTAVSLRKSLPEMASERLVIGIELFASFFIPFYFFKAGLHLEPQYFGWEAILLGLGLAAVAIPLRVGVVATYRRVVLRESWKDGSRVGLSLVPTLVFTFVLADIAREKFSLAPHLFGALVVYALVNTALPGPILRSKAPDFAAPTVPRESIAPPAEAESKTRPTEAETKTLVDAPKKATEETA